MVINMDFETAETIKEQLGYMEHKPMFYKVEILKLDEYDFSIVIT